MRCHVCGKKDERLTYPDPEDQTRWVHYGCASDRIKRWIHEANDWL